MTWGGSLNREGSDYIKKLMEAEKVIKYLEKFKAQVNPEDASTISKAIEILVNFFTKE